MTSGCAGTASARLFIKGGGSSFRFSDEVGREPQPSAGAQMAAVISDMCHAGDYVSSQARTHGNSPPYRKPKTENRKLFIILLLIGLLALGGCGRGPSPQSPIIVFGSPDSPRLRQAVAGLQARLEADPVEVVLVPEFGPEGRETLRRVRAASTPAPDRSGHPGAPAGGPGGEKDPGGLRPGGQSLFYRGGL